MIQAARSNASTSAVYIDAARSRLRILSFQLALDASRWRATALQTLPKGQRPRSQRDRGPFFSPYALRMSARPGEGHTGV